MEGLGSTRADGAQGKTIVWHPMSAPLLLTSRLFGGSGKLLKCIVLKTGFKPYVDSHSQYLHSQNHGRSQNYVLSEIKIAYCKRLEHSKMLY